MPYKTRHGSHYHMTYGCHGATESCGTEGLAPCRSCCGDTAATGVPSGFSGLNSVGSHAPSSHAPVAQITSEDISTIDAITDITDVSNLVNHRHMATPSDVSHDDTAPYDYGALSAACDGKPHFADAVRDLSARGIRPIGLFGHGSCVYGVAGPQSDRDCEVIVPDGYEGDEQFEVDDGGTVRQYTVITESDWLRHADACSVLFCECAFLPDGFSAMPLVPDGWEPDPEKVRRQFSRTASNSWVKAKKKLTVPDSYLPYVAKKSLWHSLRILMFGTQILRDGRISDYSQANGLYAEVMEASDDWEELDARFRPLRNALRSRFRETDGELGILRAGRVPRGGRKTSPDTGEH